MKILFSASAGYGHMHPLMPLAFAVKGAGHEVAWALPEPYAARAEKAGFVSFRSGISEEERWHELNSRFPEINELPPEQRPQHMFPKLFGAIGAPHMLEDLLPLPETWRPDLFVHDVSEVAAPLVAAKLGVPHVSHSFGGRLPLERFEAIGREVAPLWEAHNLEMPGYAGTFQYLYLNIWPEALSGPIFDNPGPTVSIRPVPFDTVHEEMPDWVNDLPDRPTVYVTFGTVFNAEAPFQSVIDALAEKDLNVVVTVGPSGNPDQLKVSSSNTHIERYIPQTALFARCNLVISHGGSGTVLAALSRGIPQLIMPRGADQFLNAGSCQRAGAALSIEPVKVSVQAVGEAVDRLLAEKSFREASGAIAESIAAMPSPEDTVERLEELKVT